jgi:hypothetical protein
MAVVSSTVSSGELATATQYNNLRTDAVGSTGHDHGSGQGNATISATTFDGTATVSAAWTFSSTVTIGTSLIPDAADGATIGSASAEWSDLYLADGAVIYLGNDQDVSLTHVADTGILLSSSDRLQFGDSGTYINQSTDGQLDLVADTEIQIAATTIDLNGAVAFDGALTGITNITLSGTLSDGNYTFDTSGNVSGLGTIGSGNITSTGTIQGTTITATTAFVPDASDGAALGTTSLEFSDLYLADGAVLGFGDDQDVTLTHVADTGLLLSSTDKLQFGDAGTFIHQSADGVLTIESDTTVDINGAVVLNGAITGATNITLSGELDAATLDIEGNADINGTANLDVVDIDGAVQIDATFTSGVDGQGYDTKFYGDTASAYILWDTSADKLLTAGGAVIDIVKDKLLIGGTAVTTTAAELNILDTATVTATELNLIDGGTVRGTTAIADGDGVLINDGGTMRMTTVETLATYMEGEINAFSLATTFSNTLTVGASTDGHDVKLWGNTSNTYMLWDESTDDLVLTLGAELYFYDAGGGEHIKSDGSNMTIYAGTDLNLEAGTDINIPTGVGLTFGNDGEKIEGDGADLTVTGNIINLTPAESLNVAAAVKVYINETINDKMTIGLTINQGPEDNEIIALKSSDVNHGMSAKTETDTYGVMKKFDGVPGGLLIEGYGATTRGLDLRGVHNTDDATRGTGANAPILLVAQLRDGTGAGDLAADKNLVVIANNATGCFIFDSDGSAHANVEWTTYATHDDLALVVDMEQELLLHEDEAKTERRHMLEQIGIIGKDSWHMKNGKPRVMVNTTKLSMLHHGALIQVAERINSLETQLLALQEVN